MATPTTGEVLDRVNDAVDTMEELIESISDAKAEIGNAVHKTGAETIAGVKTFSESPFVPTPEATDASQKAANMAALARIKDAAATAQATADSANATANAALPKAGGNMAGSVGFSTDVDLGNAPAEAKSKNLLAVRDASGNIIATIGYNQTAEGKADLFLLHQMPKTGGGNTWTTAHLYGFPGTGGGYFTIPTPGHGETYPKECAINKAYAGLYLVEQAPGQIHIGGDNASDTADLNYGRGLSESLPFATPAAAIAWASKSLASNGSVTFVLHDDFNWGPEIDCSVFGRLALTSDSTKRTLTLPRFAVCYNGVLVFSNIKLAIPADGNVSCFACADGQRGNPIISFSAGVEFSGTPSIASLVAYNGGKLSVGADIAGEVSGKRFSVTRGGMLLLNGKAETAIPGSIAGTHDDNSIVA